MGAKQKFREAAHIQHAHGDDDLIAVIRLNKRNGYLLNDDLMGHDRPLPLLFLDETLDIAGRTSSEHYYITSEDDLIVAALTIDVCADEIIFEQISTHDDYRGRGYARALIEAVMHRALEEGKTLRMQGPTQMGADYILPLIEKLHQGMPGLRIAYFKPPIPAALPMPAQNTPNPMQEAA